MPSNKKPKKKKISERLEKYEKALQEHQNIRQNIDRTDQPD